MSKGWHLVARLGGAGARYPHFLVDSHGWCLRLGSVPRDDDKFYSRLETILEGLVEHCVRRRLVRLETALAPQSLLVEVRDALAAARDMASTAVREAVHEASIRPLDVPKPLRRLAGSSPTDQAPPSAFILFPRPA